MGLLLFSLLHQLILQLTRVVGKLNYQIYSCDAKQFQASVHDSSIIATIQCDLLHGKLERFILALQVSQNYKALFLVCWIHVRPCNNNSVLTIYSHFKKDNQRLVYHHDGYIHTPDPSSGVNRNKYRRKRRPLVCLLGKVRVITQKLH